MPSLKGALHTHTTCSDGQLAPTELVSLYRDLGFHFVAITDHDHLLRPDYWGSLPKGDAEFLVFSGVELTVFERGYVHVGQIRGDLETLHIFNHPAEYDLPLEKLISVISSVSQRLPLDCVEVSKKGFYTPQFDVPEIPYPKVVSDDAHTPGMCGRSWVTVDCPLEKDAILREIRRGRATNWIQGRALASTSGMN
jgi:PHP-associated